MTRHLVRMAAPCAIMALAACSSGSAPRVSATAPTTTAPTTTTTTTVPAQRLDGTGTALLTHSGSHGFMLFNGTFTSPLLGHGKFHEDGTFGTKPNTKPYWTAKGTFTTANGDTLTFRSVGGVQFFDAQNNPHSATKETVVGGTGRFAGASGTWNTTGVTTVRYTFKFSGTVTTKS